MLYYLRKNRIVSSIVCLLLFFEWGMQAAAHLLLIKCFDAAFALNLHDFLLWTSANLVAWGAYYFFSILRNIAQSHAIRILNNHVRHDLYLTFLQKSHSDYHKKDGGEYLSWLTNDIKQIETLAWQPFFDCIGYFAQILWSALALSTIHWSLVIYSFGVALIMWGFPKFFKLRLEELSDACSTEQARAVAHLKDFLRGYDTFRLFQKEDYFIQEGDKSSDKIEMPMYRLNRMKTIAYGILGYCNVASQILAYVLVVFLGMNGLISIAAFGGAGNLIGSVADGINQIARCRLSFSSNKPYFQKITVHERRTLPTHPKCFPHLHKSITFDNVCFQYDNAPILNKVSLRFEKGKKYALVGPSGCGKSTLLKLILGWLTDYTGTISIDGEDIRTMEPMQIQQQISYIEQDVFLFNATIRENITLGDEFTAEQMEKALHDSALYFDLPALKNGLDTIVGEGGSNLSGGQKQRVAIARALIHNRSIVLVDEGTSALDQKNADIVEQCLLKNPDLTLILVSHHLSAERQQQFSKVFDWNAITSK